VQGISGVMSITGGPETAPYRVGYPLCDTIGGMTAAFGIAAALASRQRKGEATFIDVAMLEATLATMSWVVTNWLNFGIEPAPQSNDNVTSSPSGTFQAADKPFNIAANEQKQWKALCGVLGCQELVESEKFADREDRRTYRGELKERLEAILKTKNAADWVSLLNEAGVPSGLIMRVPEILSHPHIREREQIAEFKDVPGGGNRLRTMRPGLKLNGQPIGVKNPPVRLGENNADIFEELGIEAEELADLARQQII
jgi:formyl-CoA transferase